MKSIAPSADVQLNRSFSGLAVIDAVRIAAQNDRQNFRSILIDGAYTVGISSGYVHGSFKVGSVGPRNGFVVTPNMRYDWIKVSMDTWPGGGYHEVMPTPETCFASLFDFVTKLDNVLGVAFAPQVTSCMNCWRPVSAVEHFKFYNCDMCGTIKSVNVRYEDVRV